MCIRSEYGSQTVPTTWGFNVQEAFNNLTITYWVSASAVDASFLLFGPDGTLIEDTVAAFKTDGDARELGHVREGSYDIRVDGFPVEWHAHTLKCYNPAGRS